jgi:hypothetical protein
MSVEFAHNPPHGHDPLGGCRLVGPVKLRQPIQQDFDLGFGQGFHFFDGEFNRAHTRNPWLSGSRKANLDSTGAT